MKFLFLSLVVVTLSSCSFFNATGTADYDQDGTVSDAEYHRFNNEQEEQAKQIAEDSMKGDEGFTWSSFNPF